MTTTVRHDEQGVTSEVSMHAAVFLFNELGQVLLVRENYGRRRFGPPGGGVDAGESPQAAAIREAFEEAGVEVELSHLVGIRWAQINGDRFLGFGFRGQIRAGEPTLPTTGEIAEIGWFDAESPPQPTTNLARLMLVPARNGGRGLVFSSDD